MTTVEKLAECIQKFGAEAARNEDINSPERLEIARNVYIYSF
jgi:hypothetical protein